MTEYGIFTDEGCIESGFYTREEAEAARDARYKDEDCHVAEVCPEHPDCERENCSECDSEEEAE